MKNLNYLMHSTWLEITHRQKHAAYYYRPLPKALRVI
jgi:hypothetical protein